MYGQPNILVFMTDQQRGDCVPPHSRARTPNLDRFCRDGITFTNAFTVAPHCCPSRATFFSGLYPSQHGVWNNVNVANTLSRGLYEGVRLFTEDLRDAGYSMHYTGKWHVSAVESPLDRGFETCSQLRPATDLNLRHEVPPTSEWNRYGGGSRHRAGRREGEIVRSGYPPFTLYGESGTQPAPGNIAQYDQQVVQEAVSRIKATAHADSPWFQFVGTVGPHDPYVVPEEFLDMYPRDEIELPDSFEDGMQDKPALYRRTREKFDQLTEQEHREAIRHYLAFCTYEDMLFGRVLRALEETGASEDTLVIYLSDHGDYAGEHGLWCKGLPCFRSAYHIPVAVRWPGRLRNPGRTVDSFINMADFAPTLLEAAGVNGEREFIGRSLIPLLLADTQTDREDVLFTQSNGNELYGIQRSVMTRTWKFVYNGFDYDELYNLEDDPGEVFNLAGDQQYDHVIKSMSEKLWKFAHLTGDVCINPYVMVSLALHGPGVAFES